MKLYTLFRSSASHRVRIALNQGEQLVRYYGVYSNVSRGKKKIEEHKKDVIGKPEFVEVLPPLVSKELKKR